jgi:hypothetical protein
MVAASGKLRLGPESAADAGTPGLAGVRILTRSSPAAEKRVARVVVVAEKKARSGA